MPRTNPALDIWLAWTDASQNMAATATSSWLTLASETFDLWAAPFGQPYAVSDRSMPLPMAAGRPRVRSWYRAPVQSPFELMLEAFQLPAWRSMPGVGVTASPGLPFTVSPTGWWPQPMMPFGTSLASPFGALWADSIARAFQATAAQSAHLFAPPQAPTNPFACYRSSGGHATAQVVMQGARACVDATPMGIWLAMTGLRPAASAFV